MRDALVAVDAGHPRVDGTLVFLGSARFLHGEVHVLEVVAIAAFAAVRGFHLGPDDRGHAEAVRLVVFGGRDGAGQFVVHILHGHDLGLHLVAPLLRHVAIGTDGPHAGMVVVVDRFPVLTQVGFHGVAGHAELFRVGCLQGPVKPAPENDAG